MIGDVCSKCGAVHSACMRWQCPNRGRALDAINHAAYTLRSFSPADWYDLAMTCLHRAGYSTLEVEAVLHRPAPTGEVK